MNDILVNKKLLITGEGWYINRYHLLIKALQKHFNHIETLDFPPPTSNKKRFITRIINRLPYLNYFTKNFDSSLTTWAFKYRSRLLQKRVAELKPDIVLQIFGKACSVKNNDIPFAMMLDYTVAIAEKKHPAKRFVSPKSKKEYMEKERAAYESATYLFSWSNIVAQSLQTDYGIDRKNIIITGAGGNVQDTFTHEKKFGSKIILFNGSDFHRKGGDILIEAFKKVHAIDSSIKLYIIGVNKGIDAENVLYKGNADREELKKLFAECDIVVAPARCDPFPGFIIEAMQFGIPCIVSSNDGMPEIVDNQHNGIVLAELSASQLATAITGLLNDHATLVKYSKAAQDKIKSTLNWDVVAANIAAAFASCF
ncbi:MAG: glycosyltransferase family 4 protein [Bacteroidota bacterium]